jgi:hypothetical protein
LNKAIGILILLLYFGNYYLCDLFFKNDDYKWWTLNHSILALIIIISIKYKSENNFVEKLFNSMVVNNIYVLLFRQETTYTLNDLWFVSIFTIAQYLKKEKSND